MSLNVRFRPKADISCWTKAALDFVWPSGLTEAVRAKAELQSETIIRPQKDQCKRPMEQNVQWKLSRAEFGEPERYRKVEAGKSAGPA